MPPHATPAVVEDTQDSSSSTEDVETDEDEEFTRNLRRAMTEEDEEIARNIHRAMTEEDKKTLSHGDLVFVSRVCVVLSLIHNQCT